MKPECDNPGMTVSEQLIARVLELVRHKCTDDELKKATNDIPENDLNAALEILQQRGLVTRGELIQYGSESEP